MDKHILKVNAFSPLKCNEGQNHKKSGLLRALSGHSLGENMYNMSDVSVINCLCVTTQIKQLIGYELNIRWLPRQSYCTHFGGTFPACCSFGGFGARTLRLMAPCVPSPFGEQHLEHWAWKHLTSSDSSSAKSSRNPSTHTHWAPTIRHQTCNNHQNFFQNRSPAMNSLNQGFKLVSVVSDMDQYVEWCKSGKYYFYSLRLWTN